MVYVLVHADVMRQRPSSQGGHRQPRQPDSHTTRKLPAQRLWVRVRGVGRASICLTMAWNLESVFVGVQKQARAGKGGSVGGGDLGVRKGFPALRRASKPGEPWENPAAGAVHPGPAHCQPASAQLCSRGPWPLLSWGNLPLAPEADRAGQGRAGHGSTQQQQQHPTGTQPAESVRPLLRWSPPRSVRSSPVHPPHLTSPRVASPHSLQLTSLQPPSPSRPVKYQLPARVVPLRPCRVPPCSRD